MAGIIIPLGAVTGVGSVPISNSLFVSLPKGIIGMFQPS